MPGLLLSLQNRSLPGALGTCWRLWGSCSILTVPGGGRRRVCAGGRLPAWRGTTQLGLARGIRSWAALTPLAMAAKVDLTTSTDWKEAKSFLKGLNNKQRREQYFTRDFIKLKQIPTWKEMAKSAWVKQPEETVYPKDNHLNEKISLFRGDITKLEVDAIVNADESLTQSRLCVLTRCGRHHTQSPSSTWSYAKRGPPSLSKSEQDVACMSQICLCLLQQFRNSEMMMEGMILDVNGQPLA
ncbi:hypothetical protein JRQ81_009323 [Phrynocephalus forsythii]|uniref:O-acetyl-ADP-ribose deacetylase MACROD1 n=1 Tax=Phrynocephalus forsythii TaxID=171643 RepID=A0A9Q0XAI6_9SAUR|nr:hypothetical protein JRQ81_009323 [Phrynocephalus forsythii]